jgi:hypothetical protein
MINSVEKFNVFRFVFNHQMRFSLYQADNRCYFILICIEEAVPNRTLELQLVTNWSQCLKTQLNLSERHFQKNKK